jgi:hypothetical protein
MTGAQHYQEAERLLLEANHVGHTDPERSDRYVTAAQVHATLAVAFTTAMAPAYPAEMDSAWIKMAGGPA